MNQRSPLAWVVVVLCVGVAAVAQAKPPNIVLILCDDLGMGELGCYGQDKIRTPNIDRLAAEGTRFTQFYSGSSVCAPSRCTLLTGKHTGHCWVRDNVEVKPEGQIPLPAGTVTIGHVLHEAGYETAAIGKWGLGGPGTSGEPNRQGFDHFYGHLCQAVAHNHYTDHVWRNAERVDLEGNAVDKPVGKQYAPDLMADDAVQWLREHAKRRAGEPFFLYFPTPLPHLALQAPEEAMAPYLKLGWPETAYDGKKHYFAQEHPRAAYAAMITRIDDYVGRIMATLKEMGADGDTLVLFTSDNGAVFPLAGTDPAFFNSTWGLRGFKQDLYEGGIRAPLIAWWPGHVPKGAVDEKMVGAFWDLVPTFAKLAGVPREKWPKDLDGVDLMPALTGGVLAARPDLYWEYHSQGGAQAIRVGDWKAIRNKVATEPEGPIELYDLKGDPKESHDLAKEKPGVAAEMAAKLKGARVASPIERFNFPQRPGKAATRPVAG